MQQRLAKLLLRPSLFSGIMAAIITAILLGMALWPYTATNIVFAQYLYGPYGVLTHIQKSTDIAEFTAAFSVSPIVYNVLIAVVAALVGLGVYAILQLISKIIVGSYDTWQSIHDAGTSAKSVEREIGTRLTVRLMSVLLWVAYTLFFAALVMPYAVFITHAGFEQLFNWGFLQIIAGFIILLAAMHIHVIFMRLMFLRPRVFGGKLDIMEVVYDSHDHLD